MEIAVNKEDIEAVRQIFLDEFEARPEQFDEIDAQKVKKDEWTVKRYLLDTKGDVTESGQRLIATMKWRKENDVNNLKETDFPREFFLTTECHTYVRDRNNIPTVYIRVKIHKAMSEWNDLFQRFLILQFERLEKEANIGNTGWALIYDCSGGTLFNVDISLLNFMVSTWHSHYPSSLVYVALYELPWILRAIYYLAQTWIPERYHKLIVMLNKESIAEHVGKECLPTYLHGTCEEPCVQLIRKAPSVETVASMQNISESGLKKFVTHYSKYYDKGLKMDLNYE